MKKEIILKDNIANPKFTRKWINYSKVTIIKQYKSVNKKKSEINKRNKTRPNSKHV